MDPKAVDPKAVDPKAVRCPWTKLARGRRIGGTGGSVRGWRSWRGAVLADQKPYEEISPPVLSKKRFPVSINVPRL